MSTAPAFTCELIISDPEGLGLYVSQTPYRPTALAAVLDATALAAAGVVTLGALVAAGHEDAVGHLPTGTPEEVWRSLPLTFGEVVRYFDGGLGDIDDSYKGPTVTFPGGRAEAAEVRERIEAAIDRVMA